MFAYSADCMSLCQKDLFFYKDSYHLKFTKFNILPNITCSQSYYTANTLGNSFTQLWVKYR